MFERSPRPLPAGSQREPMQRIRVGVTGLAAVILIVALATAIAAGIRRTANATGPATPATLAQDARSAAANAAEARSEPLAQLGVAPVATDRKDVTVPIDKRPH